MSRYNRCKECYNMKCVFVTGEREDINTSECADFRPMTNADRIRSMTDEELAELLETVNACACSFVMGKAPCVWSGYTDRCPCWLDWLKSPVEVEE